MDNARKLRVEDRVRSRDEEDEGAEGEVVEVTFPHRIISVQWDNGYRNVVIERGLEVIG